MNKNSRSKLWSGRFSRETDDLMDTFNASLPFDKRLYREDIRGSIAHARMLNHKGIIAREDFNKIEKGLRQIENEIASGQFVFKNADEDIHMAIEKRLIQIIGDAGGRLHTARSRNDQVVTDMRLYLKKAIKTQLQQIFTLLKTLADLAEGSQDIILPGMTHSQSAQPITLAYHYLAYFYMYLRDHARMKDCLQRTDICPLGSGAFAGVNYDIDRTMTAEELDFGSISENAMDAVADRDFILEYLSTASILGMHLSRMAEEFIHWSGKTLDFITLDDRFATGSSIMPNKKNPDALELIRAKSGRLNGNLLSLLTIMKGLPLAYNKDLQEDKQGLFDTADQLDLCLEILPKILQTMTVHRANMKKQCEKGFLQATDVADYLVRKGITFRQAHEISGKMVAALEREGITFSDLPLEKFKHYSELFEDDITHCIELERIIANKKSSGSTSPKSVKIQLQTARKILHALATS